MYGYRKIWMMMAGLWCVTTASAQMVDSIGWRSVFTEPQLVSLIETALEHGRDRAGGKAATDSGGGYALLPTGDEGRAVSCDKREYQ